VDRGEGAGVCVVGRVSGGRGGGRGVEVVAMQRGRGGYLCGLGFALELAERMDMM